MGLKTSNVDDVIHTAGLTSAAAAFRCSGAVQHFVGLFFSLVSFYVFAFSGENESRMRRKFEVERSEAVS